MNRPFHRLRHKKMNLSKPKPALSLFPIWFQSFSHFKSTSFPIGTKTIQTLSIHSSNSQKNFTKISSILVTFSPKVIQAYTLLKNPPFSHDDSGNLKILENTHQITHHFMFFFLHNFFIQTFCWNRPLIKCIWRNKLLNSHYSLLTARNTFFWVIWFNKKEKYYLYY